MISEAPQAHRIVCELVKFSNGSIPQAKGSSRLDIEVRGRMLARGMNGRGQMVGYYEWDYNRCYWHAALRYIPVTKPRPLPLRSLLSASNKMGKLLTVMEQRPELRKALQVSPTADMTAEDRSWDIEREEEDTDSSVPLTLITSFMLTKR